MVYFFYGEDTFSIHETTNQIKQKAKQNSSSVEEIVVDKDSGDELILRAITQHFESTGLFSSKKTVILRNFLAMAKKLPRSEEYFLKSLVKAEQDDDLTLVVCEDQSVDRRRSIFKHLAKQKHSREFSLPTGEKLLAWIKGRLREDGYGIEDAAADFFLERLEASKEMGDNFGGLWQVDRELSKLMLYRVREKTIDLQSVRDVAVRNFTRDVFMITNCFAEKRPKDAIRYLEQILSGLPMSECKTESIKLLGALASQVRSLLLVKELASQSVPEIAKALGWREGRVWINAKLAKKFESQKLVSMLRDLRLIDYRLKTSDEPPRLLLTLFLQKASMSGLVRSPSVSS